MSLIPLISECGRYTGYACEFCTRVFRVDTFPCSCKPRPCEKCGNTIEPPTFPEVDSHCEPCYKKWCLDMENYR